VRLFSVESVKYKVFTKGFTTVRSARDFNLFFLGQALLTSISKSTIMHFYLLSFLHFYFFLLSIDHLEAFESAYRVNRSVLSG